MKITYREAENTDAKALLEFLSLAGGETDNLSFGKDSFKISEEKEAKFIEKFKNNRKNLMFVATCEDKVIANASIERNRIERYSHRAELSIAVLKEYWGKGIGSALMEKLVSFAKDTECKVLYLEVREDNTRAVSLYRKFGFETIGVYKSFFNINGIYYNARLMALYL